jgi:hypothetical protein
MQAEQEKITIHDIIDLYKNKMLTANPEYQRGVVWSATLKKKLIDSVLRGYPLPIIFLHHIRKMVANMQREDFEIIDGQQRITALYEFVEGSFTLFDPVKDDKEAKFPSFLKNQPCPWAGKLFTAMAEELQNQFLEDGYRSLRSKAQTRTKFGIYSSGCKVACPSIPKKPGMHGRGSSRNSSSAWAASRNLLATQVMRFSRNSWASIHGLIAARRVSSRRKSL